VAATAEAPAQPQRQLGEELLVVENLKKHFPVTRGIIFQKQIAAVKAVDDVSFVVREGETLGVVGESGCGKSTMARCIVRLLDPTDGKVTFRGRDITKLSRAEMRPIRREMMMIFQDPFASLNARKRVGMIVAEPLEVHGVGSGSEIKRRVQELLEIVGLNPEHYNRFPHEFSGGQRQRIGIARALAINPKLVVCDEPVSALDVSVQAQILNLLKDLQTEFGLTYVFIAHDLNVVRHISDRVMVMYLGKAVELSEKTQLYVEPKHPYTAALMSAVPIANPDLGRKRKQIVLEGDVPSPINPPAGCRFHPRCPRFVDGTCNAEIPELVFRGGSSQNHLAACHFPLERWPMTEEEIRTSHLAGLPPRPAEPAEQSEPVVATEAVAPAPASEPE
jgi:oligopeptide/dipeptide ABC transporter ATP-binding protein